jgi:hypothetical protein
MPQVLGVAKGYFQKWAAASKAAGAVREQKGQALIWVSQVISLHKKTFKHFALKPLAHI